MAFGKHCVHPVPEGVEVSLFARALTAACTKPQAVGSKDENKPSDPAPDWLSFGNAAKKATADAASEFLRGTFVLSRGAIGGATGLLSPGSLRDAGTFERRLIEKMIDQQVPEPLAKAWAAGVSECWNAWFTGYRIVLQFPHLASGSTPEVREGVNIPAPIFDGKSSGEFRMSAVGLWTCLRRKLGAQLEEPGAPEALEIFVQWFARRFLCWKNTAQIENVTGCVDLPAKSGFALRPVLRPVREGVMTAEPGFLSDLGIFHDGL